jgi:hypothetical protein
LGDCRLQQPTLPRGPYVWRGVIQQEN